MTFTGRTTYSCAYYYYYYLLTYSISLAIKWHHFDLLKVSKQLYLYGKIGTRLGGAVSILYSENSTNMYFLWLFCVAIIKLHALLKQASHQKHPHLITLITTIIIPFALTTILLVLHVWRRHLTCWLCWWPPGSEAGRWNTPKGPWPHSPWDWSPSTWSSESCLPAHTPRFGLSWSERGATVQDGCKNQKKQRGGGGRGDGGHGKTDVGNRNRWREQDGKVREN